MANLSMGNISAWCDSSVNLVDEGMHLDVDEVSQRAFSASTKSHTDIIQSGGCQARQSPFQPVKCPC